jgi:hypothetical protein
VSWEKPREGANPATAAKYARFLMPLRSIAALHTITAGILRQREDGVKQLARLNLFFIHTTAFKLCGELCHLSVNLHPSHFF